MFKSRKYRKFPKQSVRKFLREKQEIPGNIETNCIFLLMQPAITQQYENTCNTNKTMIHSESSNDNEMQE